MAEETLSKQERMRIEREQNKQIVRAKIAYECGTCGHHAVVPVEPDEHGLLNIPERYCGSCAKLNNFRVISGHVTELLVKTKREWGEIDNPEKSEEELTEVETDEPETGTVTTEVPAKKKATGAKNKAKAPVDED